MLLLSVTSFTYGFENDSIVYKNLIGRIDSLELALTETKTIVSEQLRLSEKLQKESKRQTNLIAGQKKDIDLLINKNDSINSILCQTQQNLKVIADSLGVKITTAATEFDKKTDLSNQKIESRTKYGLIAIIIVSVIAVTFYFLLKKRVKTNDGSLSEIKDSQESLKNTQESLKKAQESLQNAQKNLQEESIKVDNKLIELLESQMKVQQPAQTSTQDHSLVKKVADEVVRIEMNLSKMDPTIKGHKQLSNAIRHIKDNFLANGYEITDMLDKPYNEGMRVNADFIIDENLAVGTRIITSIIKPQILYNGELIQKATVKVSQNI